MGYTIRYGPDSLAEAAWKRGAGKRRIRTWSLLAILFLAAGILLSGFGGRIGDLFIPGDPEVTKAAFSQFTEDLRGGERLPDAITAFCLEILESASLPE